MVTTQFIGRLGNSMFQIATCIGYAKKYGYKWGVPSNQGESSILTHFPNLPRCDSRPRRYNEHQPGHDHDWFNYHDIPDVGPDITLFGFWQSWKYFDNAQDEVKKVFKLEHIPGYEDCISIHVRRGDYVQHANSFPPITHEYIVKAWYEISRLTNGEYFTPIFFSDDIEWCMRTFDASFPDAEYSKGRNELEDLSIMSSCEHHIIANSTFSWWGAYLGHNPDRIIISPSHKRGNWFGIESGVKQDCVDLIPPNWTQIEFR